MDTIRWLYVRLPRKIKDEFEVKELHEDILSVKMPRQKGRFCFVELENGDVADKVQKELNKKAFEKGKLYVCKKKKVREGR